MMGRRFLRAKKSLNDFGPEGLRPVIITIMEFHEFFEFSSRIFSQIFLRIFLDFSSFFRASFPRQQKFTKIPAIFQCQIPRQIRKKNSQNLPGNEAN